MVRVTRPRILVRPPSPRLADGQLTHLQRVAIDPDLARQQWQGYVEAFRSHGWAVTEVPAADEHPDGVFVEDPVVVFDDLAVLTSPGTPSRVGEVASVAPAVAGLGLDTARIEPPGHLEGGDVLKVGRTAYVGVSSRTDRAGLAQLEAIIGPRGWTVVPVPVTRALHLKSAVTALPDGTVIGYPAHVDEPQAFSTFLPVPEEHGTAVIDLGGGAVLMSADAPDTARLLERRGLRVVPVPISEFERLEGCVTCLSVRLRQPTTARSASSSRSTSLRSV
jgi:dimethylargininase